MRNLPWKKIAISAVAIVVFVAAIFYFKEGTGSKPKPAFVNPAFGEYIASYTAGVISSGSAIRLILAQDAVDSSMIGAESNVKLFQFDPSLEGKATWIDKRTVEFIPTQRLQSGNIYEVDFYLSKLFKVPDDLKTFEFSFQIIPQNYEVNVENIRPYIKTELKRQKIEGLLTTADFAENESVEKMLTASQEGKTLTLSWVHSGDGKLHNFIVEEVARKDEASEVKLISNGKPLGIERNDEKKVEIPSLKDFKLTTAKIVQNPTQYVVLQFSDPLKEKQNLDGLIRIDGVSKLDFEIHDNEIWAYPPARLAGTKRVYIEAGVRNILDYKMNQGTSADVIFEQLKPEVRFTGKGTVLPSTDGLVLPFEAVNLNSVDVQIMKIFENNILQFLQVNRLDGNYEMHRVGKKIIKKTISLEKAGVADLGKWNRYTLDLSQLINAEPGAIYQVKLSFKKAYSTYTCDGEESSDQEMMEFEEDENYSSYYEGYYDEGEYYYYDYDWEQRDNPCNSSYYYNRHAQKNILASDFGIIVKQGNDGNATVAVTDLKTTLPLPGVQLEMYNYQQQSLGTATTDAEGKAIVQTKEPLFALIAKSGAQRGYLKLQDGESLSLSQFDVSGEVVNKGLKGFLYGERGVWRPGDSLYLTFVLEDKNKVLPENHPVVFELQNPRGQIVNRLVRSVSENGFYKLATATSTDAPTGNWMGRVKVGGAEFNQIIKIETVKPNRLKINLDFGVERFTSAEVQGNLEVKWLHGAPARNLKAEFDVLLVKIPTQFKKYEDYIFEDPMRDFQSEAESVFSGSTDDEGKAVVNVNLSSSVAAPGFLSAIFRGKVFEESGNFSIDKFSLPYFPYSTYVGLKAPKGEQYTNILYTDTPQAIEFVTLDVDGKPVDRNLQVSLYKVDTRWWWDYDGRSMANYVQSNSSSLVKKATVNTSKGKASWSFEIKSPDWGRYFVRACDPASGHCTGKVIYVDEPGWYSRYRNNTSQGAASLLSVTTDKASYQVGEKVKLTIPSSNQGRALVSIESGSKVLQTFWVEAQKGQTNFTFDVEGNMAPNAYVYISLLQPHSQTVNDLPIRLYGVVPIMVEDPQTHLEPVITMPDAVQPGEEITVKVSEKSKRKMTYTLAIVDEGLLDITRFKTPDLWSKFYAREALGVRTWDLYDQVIGAFGGRLERLLAVGGDMEMEAKEDDAKVNRFKPVVKFFGPFTSDGTNTHRFIMPQYIGSVKVMVVAGYEGAYGKAEKAVPVRKPLMVLATLPRVLGPEEKVKLPVTLFTQEKSIRNVKVDVKTTGPVSVSGNANKSVTMSSSGDLTIDFDLSVKSQTGIATIEVTATSGNHTATDVIEIEVRNPNLPVTKVMEMYLDAGKSWNTDMIPYGILGTNKAVIEVSNIPPINLDSRLRYLISYPYGCVEQTVSAVFPQLYLDQVKVLTENEKAAVQRNVTAGIERLKAFMHREGGFTYWPGSEDYDSWSTSYAGHFLVEAEARGFYVPADMIKRWKKNQRNKALEWRRNNKYYNTDLIQAYRLYTLALAGSPELGSMNRLHEMGGISTTTTWMLAASYAKAGQPEAARKMVASLPTAVAPYRELSYSYGSDLRDKALILETLVLLNEKTKAFEVLKEVSGRLSNYGYWMSTQEVAFSLKAVAAFVGLEKRGDLKFNYAFDNGKQSSHVSALPVAQIQIPINGVKKQNINVQNESTGSLFVRVIMEGTPARGQEEDAQKGLQLSIRYTDTNGNVIDPTRLEQGMGFIAEVSVTHPGMRSTYENLALAQVFPPGWEINNLRLDEAQDFLKSDYFTYQDIRDDRVYTYFDLTPGTTRLYKIMLTASYAGTYYLPAVSCEAMYDNSIYARKKGRIVEVVKAVTQ